MSSAQEVFDRLAPTYDADFTDSLIGRLQREQVRSRLNPLFPPNAKLLDLGCGTGEDALYFAARGCFVEGIDLSAAMIAVAETRAGVLDLDDRTSFTTLALEDLDELPERGFDGAYSNFSALNCVEDLSSVAAALAERLRPGAKAALSFMNRRCLWETLLFPLALTIHRTARSWTDDWAEGSASGDDGFPVFHPSVSQVRSAFAPWFRLVEAPGIAVFTPPTYLEPFAQRFPRLIRLFSSLDRRVAGQPLLRLPAEHRLLILERV